MGRASQVLSVARPLCCCGMPPLRRAAARAARLRTCKHPPRPACHIVAREDRFSALYKYASAIDVAWNKLLEIEEHGGLPGRSWATELRELGASARAPASQ